MYTLAIINQYLLSFIYILWKSLACLKKDKNRQVAKTIINIMNKMKNMSDFEWLNQSTHR